MKFFRVILFSLILVAHVNALIHELPKQDHVFAIGDIHGDFEVLKTILLKAKLINSKLDWSGGTHTVVQVGDILDRGADELKIIKFLKKMEKQSAISGGRFIVLNGNHEAKNVDLKFNDVNEISFADFEKYNTDQNRALVSRNFLENFPEHMHGRALAMMPGGKIAKYFSTHSTVLKIGQTIFVHGGVEPKYAKMGITKINTDLSNWMRGSGERFDYFFDEHAPLYSRIYSKQKEFDSIKSCEKLDKALEILDSKRMIVAHSVQPSINSECDQKVWRIDTGMSKAYDGGGQIGILEIIDDKYVKVHTF